MFRRSSHSLSSSSSSAIREKPFNVKGLKYLRTFFGFYSSTPCHFHGSPAFPAGPSEKVRYESLDVVSSSSSSSSIKNNNNNNNKYLHRIHHIAGFISSLYVAEYRTINTTGSSGDNSNAQQELFLLDCGISTDVTRLEVALRHVLIQNDQERKAAEKDTRVISDRMKMVFSTHAHADHFGSARNWVRRGVPVSTVPDLEAHFDGFFGKFQWWFEACGANIYAWYLKRTFPEFTWFNPYWKVPQISEKPQIFGKEVAEKIPNNRISGGSTVPLFDDWIVFQAPGHTHHMGILYHPKSQSIYVADMFLFQMGKFRPPIPIDRLDCYLKSMEMIQDLPVKWILMAHGGIMKVGVNDSKKEKDSNTEVPKSTENANKNEKKKVDVTQTFDSSEHETPLNFREICESVAQRAIKTSKAQAGKTSFVVKAARALASSSPAPKSFDWEEDMLLPEVQLECAKKHPDFFTNEKVLLEMKHVANYTRDILPKD